MFDRFEFDTYKMHSDSFIYGLVTGSVVCYLTVAFLNVGVHQWTIRVESNPSDIKRSVLSEDNTTSSKQYVQPPQFKDEDFHHDDATKAKALADKIRVLYWIMTSPETLETKAMHVKNTWGKRCNILLFMSSIANESFPAVGLNVNEGREHLTAKTMLAFQYVYQHYLNRADWFLKADDDTYVIVENLRYFLSGENTETPVFFGHHFRQYVKQGYFSGGAGYVLSKEALRRFGKKGKYQSMCSQYGTTEDFDLGICMQRLGVKTGNSTDILGRSRFHCFKPEDHLHGYYPAWYYDFDSNGAKKGMESISDYVISFHYVEPWKMYDLEFFIYHLRPYGIHSHNMDLNRKSKLALHT